MSQVTNPFTYANLTPFSPWYFEEASAFEFSVVVNDTNTFDFVTVFGSYNTIFFFPSSTFTLVLQSSPDGFTSWTDGPSITATAGSDDGKRFGIQGWAPPPGDAFFRLRCTSGAGTLNHATQISVENVTP